MDKFCKKDTTLSVCKHCLVVECPSRVQTAEMMSKQLQDNNKITRRHLLFRLSPTAHISICEVNHVEQQLEQNYNANRIK